MCLIALELCIIELLLVFLRIFAGIYAKIALTQRILYRLKVFRYYRLKVLPVKTLSSVTILQKKLKNTPTFTPFLCKILLIQILLNFFFFHGFRQIFTVVIKQKVITVIFHRL